MHLLQGLLSAILFATRISALVSCNDTSFNTMFWPGPNFTNAMPTNAPNTITVTVTLPCLTLAGHHANAEPLDSTQIGTTSSGNYQGPPALINATTLAPGAAFPLRPFLNLTDPLMADEAVVAPSTNLTICNFLSGHFGFNSANICSSTAPTSIVPSNTLTLANTSTILSTTNFPTFPSLSSDTAQSTSTTVVVVSLATNSATASATSASNATTTNPTSAACPRPKPLRALFWFNWMTAKARDLVVNEFGDYVNAEKAKTFMGTEGAMLDSHDSD